MIIEESVIILAGVRKVWETFVDLSCWENWNTVLGAVSNGPDGRIAGGSRFACVVRPFVLPVYFEPLVEEVVPCRKIIWTARKYGISARHEFLFDGDEERTTVMSRETFAGLPFMLAGRLFPAWRIRELTVSLLHDLKSAAESR